VRSKASIIREQAVPRLKATIKIEPLLEAQPTIEAKNTYVHAPEANRITIVIAKAVFFWSGVRKFVTSGSATRKQVFATSEIAMRFWKFRSS
jgi:hypothetical protein